MAQSTQYRGREHEVSSAVSDLKDKAVEQAEKLADKASDVAGKVADQSRDAGQRVQEVAGNIKGAVDKSVKEQPMATLAVAALVGFVLGALWKR